MNTSQLPSIELIQGHPASAEPRGPARWRRWAVFFTVLLVSAAVGLVIVYARTPVYRAAASVLTVKPKAVDTRSAEADVEHVTIQSRLLLGEELLGRLSQLLEQEGDGDAAGLDRLRSTLAVTPVPETNLLELRAEGEDPAQLQRVVNRWAASYEEFRAEEIEAATGRTTAELEDEQAEIRLAIDAARAELKDFRESRDIVSLERGENRSVAKLNGLNDSVNKARDRLIETRAKRAAVEEAITRGDTVIPNEQKSDITRMKLTVQRGRAQLNDLRQKYTQTYLDRDPVLKALPGELRAMENELAHALDLARNTVRDEAQQEVEAAQVAVDTAENALAEHQRAVQLFTEDFKEFKTLEDKLARFETLLADNQERLAQIQVRNLKKYPPIQIVEWARVPDRPIYPDYERDLMIALGGSLLLALFATWLVEYLSERSRPAPAAPYLGVRVYPGDQAAALGSAQPDQQLIHQPPPAASQTTPPHLPVLPRELAQPEVRALMTAMDPQTAAYATLLLSGISPYELPLLHMDAFDREAGRIVVDGANRRELPIEQDLWYRIEGIVGEFDESRMALPVAELDQRLLRAAQDGKLADPGSVNAVSLWHSYVLFLIRQGIDMSMLTRRVGSIPAEIQPTLMHYAPPGGTRPLDRIDFTHPGLKA